MQHNPQRLIPLTLVAVDATLKFWTFSHYIFPFSVQCTEREFSLDWENAHAVCVIVVLRINDTRPMHSAKLHATIAHEAKCKKMPPPALAPAVAPTSGTGAGSYCHLRQQRPGGLGVLIVTPKSMTSTSSSTR